MSIRTVLLKKPSNVKEIRDIIYKEKFYQRPAGCYYWWRNRNFNITQSLKEYTSNITAIVTVADDGGGSGVLEMIWNTSAGDIRNCMLRLLN